MAEDAGFGDVAEPPELVADAIIEEFKTGEFHIYVGKMARQMGQAYQSFADSFVEAELIEVG
jgi:hypothetical protein